MQTLHIGRAVRSGKSVNANQMPNRIRSSECVITSKMVWKLNKKLFPTCRLVAIFHQMGSLRPVSHICNADPINPHWKAHGFEECNRRID